MKADPNHLCETGSKSRILAGLAAKYIWWKPVPDALKSPDRIAAQVMTMGDYADVCLLVRGVGERALRHVLETAEAGVFDARSWHYWHYRLGLAEVDQVPPMPSRKVHGVLAS